ncbi:uncharacterized protein LOC126901897 [Daktulosphaira vitifoliae]|uniref:uncharacterized protein LOC126901897 n=1 Tax=Daktulosphaira vitifoliae TaxID=58002 RepID=UPI0021A9D6CF|nr:uncharacterized protein LOC126901897 [Daktulosphaira vitifoliae]XP_050534771.1 uncharacterized protein LOC126901897 [Daktulosphaira vitifoliae]XP_050534772.1 uncharacterized protein LOC126901897 [Daktulosphaira vitifoliae]
MKMKWFTQYLFLSLLINWVVAATRMVQENLDEKFKDMMDVMTGIEYSVDQHTNITPKFFKMYKRIVVEDLKCSYAHNSLYYVSLTRYIIENGNEEIFNRVKSIPEYSFTDIVKSMMTTMKNCDYINSMEILWWVYMFVVYFYEIIVNPQVKYDKKIITDTCETVVKSLSEFAYNDICNCNTANKRNRIDIIYSQIPKSVDDWNDFLDNRTNLLQEHYSVIITQFEMNSKFTSAINGMNSFDFSKLSMNHVFHNDQVVKRLMRDFGEINNWEVTLHHIKQDYQLVHNMHERIERRFAILGQVQSKIICLLKIIMLQILTKYMYYVNEYVDCDNNFICTLLSCSIISFPIVMKEMNTIISTKLKDFIDILDLHKDPDFKIIPTLFDDAVSKTKVLDANQNVTDAINNNLIILSRELYNCELSYSKDFNFEYTNNSINISSEIAESLGETFDFKSIKPIFKDSIMRSTVFIRYIKKHFLICFKTINSFIQFTKIELKNFILNEK